MCDLSLRVVERRCVIGGGAMSVTVVLISHSSVNPQLTSFTSRSLSTHVGCLLTTDFLGQKHLCVTTMFVYVLQTPPPRSKWLCWSVLV